MTSVSNDSRRKITGVLGLPINKKGQVLLTLRNAPNSKFWHKKWQIAGGEIEFGETPEQALAREMYEELGVSVRILHSYPAAKTIVYEKGSNIDFDEDVHLTLLCYLVDIGHQKISLENDPEKETKDYKWFYPKQVHDIRCLPLTKEFVQEAIEIIKSNKLLK